jgi:hypothetical protein
LIKVGLLKQVDPLEHSFRCRALKEHSGLSLSDRFRHSSGTEGDHRTSTGLSFDRNQSKVLQTRKNERPSPTVEFSNLLIRQPTQKPDIGPCLPDKPSL